MRKTTAEETKIALERLFARADGNYSGIRRLVFTETINTTEAKRMYDCKETALRLAVDRDLCDYVFTYIREVYPNDFTLGGSPYIKNAKSIDMKKIVAYFGGKWLDETYRDCLLAVETLNGTVLKFDVKFQKELVRTFMKLTGFSEKTMLKQLKRTFEISKTPWIPERLKVPFEHFTFKEVADMLRFGCRDGKLTVSRYHETREPYRRMIELVESMGYRFLYDGTVWRGEPIGIFYIKDMKPKAKPRTKGDIVLWKI